MNVYAASQWTIMVYLDADNNLEPDGIDDFLEIATIGSDENINYVVQMDRIQGYTDSHEDWTDCKRFYVEKDMTPIAQNAVQNLGEINMGNPDTLTDFIQWAMSNYPAQQYALILWDHGDGWQRKRRQSSALKSICWDDTNSSDASISMLDLKQILMALPIKPTLVGFDACLMGMLENAYMLKKAGISVMVGSEETEPAAGWPYDSIAHGLANNPQWDAAQLGNWIVEKYYLSYNRDQTQSAIDLSKIDPLVSALSTFATSLRTSWQDDINAIRNAAQTLRMRIDNAVISSKNGDIFREAGGLSIYFPNYYYDSRYDQTDLAKNTAWNEFLMDYRDTMSSSWVNNVRQQVLGFDDSDLIDLHHLCTKIQSFDPDLYQSHYTVEKTSYDFDDISSSGVQESLSDDAILKIEPSNFRFQYHDKDYSTFYISDNGLIFFENATSGWGSNDSIPSSQDVSSFIAPFWDDFNGATIYWQVKNSATDKQLIVQWQDMYHYDYTDASPVTFQAVLYENGRICFQYKDTEFEVESIDYGHGATVGIQEGEFSGIQYSYEKPLINSSLALLFIPDDDSICRYSLSSYHHNIDAQGESRNVALMTGDECQWQASSQENWIHIESEKSGEGPSQIRFQVSENKGLLERTGQIIIADLVVTVVQKSPCEYDISPLTQAVPSSGGLKQLTITTSLPSCSWFVDSQDAWIIPQDSLGSGNGTISYSVTKNPTMNKRTGSLTINDQAISIIQDAAPAPEAVLLENNTSLKNLSLQLSERLYYKIELPPEHYSLKISTSGGTGDCDIYAAYDYLPTDEMYDHSSANYNNDEEIMIPEPAAGAWYILLRAYEPFQAVNLNVSYLSFQCEYVISPSRFEFSSEASTGAFEVSTNDQCSWSVPMGENEWWVNMPEINKVFYGNGTIAFSVLENTSLRSRIASFNILNQEVVINQQGNENIETTPLENGVPLEQRFGSENSYQYYKFTVPDNQEELIIKTWSGTGDCDLYVGYNELPDHDNYIYVADDYSNDERIVIQAPSPGDYFILLYGYGEYSDVMLQAEYRSAHCTYSVSETEINTGSSEYIGQIAITTQEGCSWQALSMENWITIDSSPAGTGSGVIVFSVDANESSSPRTGSIQVADTMIFINQDSSLDYIVLTNNIPKNNISVPYNQILYFAIDVPANQRNLIIDTWGGTGDIDLYAHYGRIPVDITPDYKCYAWGNDENIYIRNPDEGRWFIFMVGYETSQDITIKAVYNTLDCQYRVTPMQSTVDYTGGAGYLNIFVNEGCAWTTIKHGTWIEIDESTRRGTGNGHVRYTVTTNDNTSIRTNNIRVADQWVGVMQTGTQDLFPMHMQPDTPVPLSGLSETSRYFQVSITEPTHLSFVISGGSGDCDLYVRHDAFPTFRLYDFRPYLYGNDESVVIKNASPGIWYVMIYAEMDFEDAQFTFYNNALGEGQLSDLIRVLQVLAGFEIEATDINSNGFIDIGDAIMILQAY